ncbi:craniofacial development protein 1 [Lucilia sericata]|uniref:craniofacial development protein 1 n=1 Tax=Lucilia sericata TaxID=13632 RepID=UPI0018A8217D|nr:craniofacial development protein 1 [Lucilia sericata]
MNKEQDYASDTDESDEDFRPDNAAGESPVSEDEEEDCESNEELANGTQHKDKPEKRKRQIKKLTKKKKSKVEQEDESEDDEDEAIHTTSRRATRQTNDADTNGKGSTLEKDELVSDEEDKSRTNALWADFLKDVNPTATSAKANPSKAQEDKPSSSSSKDQETSKKNNISTDNQTTSSLSPSPKVEETKIVVTEVVDFAGEEVRIQREVDASSIKENKAATIPPAKKQPFSRIMPGAGLKRTIPTAATGSAGGGLGSILNQLGKKKKLSVLEKSQMDWKSFKQTEGIDEQLQTFNKGKDGYLERQDFLQRTDIRQFEIEKNLRQSTRRPH